MGHISKPPLGEADARLLRELRKRYPGDDNFDEINVATAAPSAPDLLDALNFLGVKVDRRHRALSHRSRDAVEEWIKQVEGRPADGLVLRRDKIGWCSVVGATGPAG
jgi:hypothetical protein